jgi:hypothetical protein
VVYEHNPVGTGGIVITSGARERALSNLSHDFVVVGIYDVDRFVGTIAEDVKLEDRVDEADVEGNDILIIR